MVQVRRANFSGSWYEKDSVKLKVQINAWLDNVKVAKDDGRLKLLIVPHAGYVYSGHTAAHCYKLLRDAQPTRIILIGPSHRAYLGDTVVRSSFDELATPLGNLDVCPPTSNEPFELASPQVDEAEHSLEMQLPFIRLCCPNVQILPLIAGANPAERYARFVAKQVKESNTIVVVSSDFCHWGCNYNYFPKLDDYGEGSQSRKIHSLDEQAIACIQRNSLADLRDYLRETGNTICGQGPILLALKSMEIANLQPQWQLLYYSQSNQIADYNPQANSVSYVAMAGFV